MSFYKKHSKLLHEAITAISERKFYTPYPEHPKAYADGLKEDGKTAFGRLLNSNFEELAQEADQWIGEEVSPFWQLGLGVHYPSISAEDYISNSQEAANSWSDISVEERAGLLTESLERIKSRFFELAFANMHTSGQTFLMSFQAAGPHAADRALEAVAMGLQELTRFPKEQTWTKPMGKFEIVLEKNWKPIPKGIGLVIGCSTFPTWNTVPGLFADLVCGNTAIVKPHPKSILPIAIVVSELRKVMTEVGVNPNAVQLAVDTMDSPIAKELANNREVQLIDYTGGNEFGDYLETLSKQVFTEKSGVNSIILDSVDEIIPVAQNIAFSSCLYSGQMCTAPQNVLIPSTVSSASGGLSFDEVALEIVKAMKGVLSHPKMGASTIAAIQNDHTLGNIENQLNSDQEVLLGPMEIKNEEFPNARIHSPIVIKVKSSEKDRFSKECFGPIIYVVETRDTIESVSIAASLAKEKGAITCSAYSTSGEVQKLIEDKMNKAFTPVSFNLVGGIFVNQAAAFSDFHVSGGNPAGNASFVNPDYINRRFVWVGNRKMD